MLAKKLGDIYVNIGAKGAEKVKKQINKADKAGKKAETTFTKLSKTLKMLAGGFMAFQGARVFTNFLKDAINKSMIYEKHMAKLVRQLRNWNEYTEENIKALKDQAAALQKLTTFSRSEITAAQAVLGSFALTTKQIKEFTPRLLDAAVMTENTTGQMQDLATTAKLLATSTSGLIGRLKLMGIVLSEQQEILWKLSKPSEKLAILFGIIDYNAKGLAEAVGKTMAGQMKQTEHTVDDLKMAIADDLIPAMRDLLEVVDALMPAIKLLTSSLAVFSWQARTRGGLENWIKGLFGVNEEARKQLNLFPGIEAMLLRWKILTRDLGDETETTATAFEEAIKQYRLFLELDAARADIAGRLARGYEEEGKARQALTQYELDWMAIRAGKVEQTEEEIEQMTFLSDLLYGINGALLNSSESWFEWGENLVKTIGRVIAQLIIVNALMAAFGTSGGGGGSGGGFFSLLAGIAKMLLFGGGFQNPVSDTWAYREGRDFGKNFFGGIEEQFKQMTSNINVNQEPVNIVIHTGDPSTFVEFVSGMPNPHKSKFYREVTEKARLLES